MNDIESEKLAQKIADAQSLPIEHAKEVADEIAGADGDIVEAARHWIETGNMPDIPKIAGYTPMSLDEFYWPSQTFTLLMALRHNADNALQGMRHLPGRSVPPGAMS